MKRLLLIPIAALLLSACNDTNTYYMRGVLYADSTLSTPIPNASLTFGLGWNQEYYLPEERTPLDTIGHAMTDAQGRWGYAYNITIDPIARNNAKFQVDYKQLIILYGDDTLYMADYNYNRKDTLSLYPSCWTHRKYYYE